MNRLEKLFHIIFYYKWFKILETSQSQETMYLRSLPPAPTFCCVNGFPMVSNILRTISCHLKCMFVLIVDFHSFSILFSNTTNEQFCGVKRERIFKMLTEINWKFDSRFLWPIFFFSKNIIA